jgi:hypothetical protein
VEPWLLPSPGWSGLDFIMSGFQKRDPLIAKPEAFSELQLWFEHDLFDQRFEKESALFSFDLCAIPSGLATRGYPL